MSHSNNYPPFSFNVDGSFYDSQSTQVSNASYSQWNSEGSRTMGNMPSPAPSVRTVMTAPMTAPNPRSYNRASAAQSNLFSGSRIDPNLPGSFSGMLNVPSGDRPRSAMDNQNNVDFMSRIYASQNEEPWSTMRPRNASINNTGRNPYVSPSTGYQRQYARGPGSDLGSIAPRSDSGYQTQQAQSVISNEPERLGPGLSSAMPYQVSGVPVGSASSEPTEAFPNHSDVTSQYSGRSTQFGKADLKCTVSGCNEVSKCASDAKKHKLKHDKPHVCDIATCKRRSKGFTTINDLVRHKKSVHRIGVEKDSYQCASEHCRNRGKIWPRLDNFKQHINRMHKDEDESDLINRSIYKASDQVVPSVAPLDTTLAGIGPEERFAGNELDDPTPVISLTPDQDTSQWSASAFDPSSHNFAMDVDRTNAKAANGISGNVPNFGYHVANQSSTSTSTSTQGHRPRQESQDSLNVLADVASTQTSPAKPANPSQRTLSNAPQTKAEQSRAEQQRQALQKMSRGLIHEIRNAPSADSVDIEQVVMRLLYGATSNNRRDSSISNSDKDRPSTSTTTESEPNITMTKAEAMKASQAISNLIKQSGAAPSSNRPPRPRAGSSANMIKCDQCEATLHRSCDMKKHMKRHTKPYGCTYPKCHKRFGAKSDWKRHENSQHFQLETFRCQQILPSSSPNSPPTPCGDLFYRPDLFKSHLSTKHSITSTETLDKEVKARRIGKNGQGQFWCGFCKAIKRLEKKRNAAWDERFDHIDQHFNKEKMSIEMWLCVEAKKMKGEVLREMNRLNFDEDEMDDYGVGETDESPPGAAGETGNGYQRPRHPVPRPHDGSSASGKRKAAVDLSDPPPSQKRRREVDVYCCTCSDGPWSDRIHAACVNCNHEFCPNCTRAGVRDPGMMRFE